MKTFSLIESMPAESVSEVDRGNLAAEHTGERCTVFVPSVPAPMTGALYIIARSRVHPLDLPVMTMMKCISKWGAGSSQLVAAYDAAEERATLPTPDRTKVP